MPPERVYPLSARQALAARVEGDTAALAQSRLPALEAALGEQLMPQRRALLERVVLESAQQIEAHVARRLNDSRRQLAEQTLELRGLRGKSGAKVRLMLQRLDTEVADFDRCTARIAALRAVHARLLRSVMAVLASDNLRRITTSMGGYRPEKRPDENKAVINRWKDRLKDTSATPIASFPTRRARPARRPRRFPIRIPRTTRDSASCPPPGGS